MNETEKQFLFILIVYPLAGTIIISALDKIFEKMNFSIETRQITTGLNLILALIIILTVIIESLFC